MICSDSGLCISFGIETKRISRFFGGFEKFNNIANIRIIGQNSVNGNIYEIKYELDNYIAYSILKNSKQITSDSLIYEYFVGTFINTKHMIYPCFLETYEIYKSNNIQFTSSTNLKNMISSKNIDNPKNNIYKTLIDLTCSDNNAEFSLLIQHIKDAKRLQDCLDYKKQNIIVDRASLYEFEIFFILFQIYHALSELHDSFTHYDLHLENVLLYEPINGSYIQYNYKLKNGQEINFKSKYIVKIIDYGKCFFSINTTSSLSVRNYICGIANCECGKKIGFNSITEKSGQCTHHHICSYKKNISHDLRLLFIINMFAFDIPLLRDITEKVVYTSNYGTPELINSGLPSQINNILDAFSVILETIQKPEIIERNNNYYQNFNLLGNLTIYGGNKNMVFNKTE